MCEANVYMEQNGKEELLPASVDVIEPQAAGAPCGWSTFSANRRYLGRSLNTAQYRPAKTADPREGRFYLLGRGPGDAGLVKTLRPIDTLSRRCSSSRPTPGSAGGCFSTTPPTP